MVCFLHVLCADLANEQLYSLTILETEGDEHEKERFVKRRVAELQRNMDLENGPLVQAGLFRSEAEDYLFLTVHHLAVDGSFSCSSPSVSKMVRL